MTAHTLARLLLDGPDLPVYVQACESGLKDAPKPEAIRVLRNRRKRPPWYDGEHEPAGDEAGEPGLLLSR